MLLGIDHLVIAVVDPDEAVEALASLLGTEPGGGGRHPGWGTWNRILWLGDTFIELLGINDDELAARSWLGAPALATRATWPALIGWAIATDDLDADAEAMRDLGAGNGPAIEGERVRPDGRIARWRLSLPDAISLARPFLIEHDASAPEWTPGDRAARKSLPGRVVGLELPVDGIHGVAIGAHDRAVMLGEQRVVARGSLGRPVIHVDSTSLAVRTRRLGCDWLPE